MKGKERLYAVAGGPMEVSPNVMARVSRVDCPLVAISNLGVS